MYKIEYLQSALRDMVGIVKYISDELKNPAAAKRLAEEMPKAGEKLSRFPYSHPAYMPIKPLKHEYRRVLVRGYLIFYWVDEAEKEITVARVIHDKTDYSRILK